MIRAIQEPFWGYFIVVILLVVLLVTASEQWEKGMMMVLAWYNAVAAVVSFLLAIVCATVGALKFAHQLSWQPARLWLLAAVGFALLSALGIIIADQLAKAPPPRFTPKRQGWSL